MEGDRRKDGKGLRKDGRRKKERWKGTEGKMEGDRGKNGRG